MGGARASAGTGTSAIDPPYDPETHAMSRTRVKICGITRPEQARAAAGAGADAIGLMFYEPSPRFVTRARAAAVCAALPPLVSVVGVFVNPAPREIEAMVDGLPVDLLQFHGEEPPELCAAGRGKPYVKAVRVRTRNDVVEAAARAMPMPRALLLDAHHDALWGGTGTRFDWDVVPDDVDHPIVLAGATDPGERRRRHPPGAAVRGGRERRGRERTRREGSRAHGTVHERRWPVPS